MRYEMLIKAGSLALTREARAAGLRYERYESARGMTDSVDAPGYEWDGGEYGPRDTMVSQTGPTIYLTRRGLAATDGAREPLREWVDLLDTAPQEYDASAARWSSHALTRLVTRAPGVRQEDVDAALAAGPVRMLAVWRAYQTTRHRGLGALGLPRECFGVSRQVLVAGVVLALAEDDTITTVLHRVPRGCPRAIVEAAAVAGRMGAEFEGLVNPERIRAAIAKRAA